MTSLSDYLNVLNFNAKYRNFVIKIHKHQT